MTTAREAKLRRGAPTRATTDEQGQTTSMASGWRGGAAASARRGTGHGYGNHGRRATQCDDTNRQPAHSSREQRIQRHRDGDVGAVIGEALASDFRAWGRGKEEHDERSLLVVMDGRKALASADIERRRRTTCTPNTGCERRDGEQGEWRGRASVVAL
jgi:hypothetical protein